MASRELFQKAQIILHEEADIGNIEQNHREPIHSETECVAAPFLRIVSLVAARLIYRFEDRRMYYARTGDFNPLLPSLEHLRFHIHFKARLGEWKIVWTKLDSGSGTEKFAHEKFERAFEIGNADVLIDVKPFDLVKLRAVSGIEFIAPISRARRDHA